MSRLQVFWPPRLAPYQVVTITYTKLTQITYYLLYCCQTLFFAFSLNEPLMPHRNRYKDWRKTISTMGMSTFPPKKYSSDFSSVTGSRHFLYLGFIFEQSYVVTLLEEHTTLLPGRPLHINVHLACRAYYSLAWQTSTHKLSCLCFAS